MSASDAGGTAGGRRIVDEGMQPERTSLAWERTALTLAATAALIGRAGAEGVPAARIVAFVLLALAAAGFVVSRTRYVRRDASLRGEGPAPGHRLVLAAGAVAVVTSVCALAATVVLTLG